MKTLDVYGDGSTVIDISKASAEQQRLIRFDADHCSYAGPLEAQDAVDEIMTLHSVDDVDNYYGNTRGWYMRGDDAPAVQHAVDAYSGIHADYRT